MTEGETSEDKPAQRLPEEKEAQRSDREVPQSGAARDTQLAPTLFRAPLVHPLAEYHLHRHFPAIPLFAVAAEAWLL